MELKKEINNYIVSHSWFELDGCIEQHYTDTNLLEYRTRENGSVGTETYGKKDLNKAYILQKELLEKFPNEIEMVNIEIVEEWVCLDVLLVK